MLVIGSQSILGTYSKDELPLRAWISDEVDNQITVGSRNRAFEAAGIVDAFTSLERQLASPEGTRSRLNYPDESRVDDRAADRAKHQ